MITDSQKLVGAKQFGFDIPVYDDGSGRLWILCNSMGVAGIVRAADYETAFAICEDEFFPEADLTLEEIRQEFDFECRDVKIIRDKYGVERPAQDNDYPLKEKGNSFVRWETVKTPKKDSFPDNPVFQEQYGFRPSGANIRDKYHHGIYQKDINGELLEELKPETVEALMIILDIREN